jgi:hypothetical protein
MGRGGPGHHDATMAMNQASPHALPAPVTDSAAASAAVGATARQSALLAPMAVANNRRVRATLRRDMRVAARAAGTTMAVVFLVDALTLGEPAPGQLLPNLVGAVLILVSLVFLRGPGRRRPNTVAFAIGMVGVGAVLAPIMGAPSVRYLMLAYYALLTISMAVFMPWDGRWHGAWVGTAFGCLVLAAVSPAAAGGPFAEHLMMIGLAASMASVVGHGVLHRRRLRAFAVEQQLRSVHVRMRSDQVELRRLNTELLAVSRADPLTRVGNRLRFEEDMRLLLSRSQQDVGAGALGLLDVDNFKKYNDAFGHLAGDAVLRAIADAIGRAVRTAASTASVARSSSSCCPVSTRPVASGPSIGSAKRSPVWRSLTRRTMAGVSSR